MEEVDTYRKNRFSHYVFPEDFIFTIGMNVVDNHYGVVMEMSLIEVATDFPFIWMFQKQKVTGFFIKTRCWNVFFYAIDQCMIPDYF